MVEPYIMFILKVRKSRHREKGGLGRKGIKNETFTDNKTITSQAIKV